MNINEYKEWLNKVTKPKKKLNIFEESIFIKSINDGNKLIMIILCNN